MQVRREYSEVLKMLEKNSTTVNFYSVKFYFKNREIKPLQKDENKINSENSLPADLPPRMLKEDCLKNSQKLGFT